MYVCMHIYKSRLVMYNFIMYVCTHPQLKYKTFSSHTERYVRMTYYTTQACTYVCTYTAGFCRTWVDSLCFQWEGLVPIIGEYVYWCTVPRYRENLQNRGIHSSDTEMGIYVRTHIHVCTYVCTGYTVYTYNKDVRVAVLGLCIFELFRHT